MIEKAGMPGPGARENGGTARSIDVAQKISSWGRTAAEGSIAAWPMQAALNSLS